MKDNIYYKTMIQQYEEIKHQKPHLDKSGIYCIKIDGVIIYIGKASKDDKLYARYYLKDVERNSKYEYTFSLQSAIGLLDDSNHYGGIYSGQTASDIIKDIIGGKITYTEHNIFSKIKVYGWLPVATRRDNLKQLLFAVGGCVKKKDGIINFTTLTVDTPTEIPANRVYDSGKITYNAPACQRRAELAIPGRAEIANFGRMKIANHDFMKYFTLRGQPALGERRNHEET